MNRARMVMEITMESGMPVAPWLAHQGLQLKVCLNLVRRRKVTVVVLRKQALVHIIVTVTLVENRLIRNSKKVFSRT